jgi:C-terminal processing protease CtpA/Prc
MRYVIILLCFLLTASLIGVGVDAQAPDKEWRKYPPDAIRSDFLLLRDTLQKIHPGIYRYKTKEVMDALLDSCYSSIRDSMTVFEFYRVVSVVIAAIEDGHADCKLPQYSMLDLVKHTRMWPWRLWFTADKTYVFCGKNGFAPGTEIVSIDRHPIGEIINRMFDCLPSDGAIRTGKLHALNDNFRRFSLLYCFVYGPKSIFTVEYRNVAGEIQEADLPADYVSNIRCDIKPEEEKGLGLDFRPNGVAVLTVGTFETGKEKFDDFLESSFAEINRKQCKALIIDLRNNGGGADGNGAALYSYLTNKSFSYYSSLEAVQRKIRPEEHPQLQLQQPAANPFLGKAYFLINGNSFSATAEFSAVARSEKRGVFIGEETGGGYYGNTSGYDRLVVLPNTDIRVDVPLIKYTMAVRPAEYPDRGIIPEYPVGRTLADMMAGRDVVLAYALNLAGAN